MNHLDQATIETITQELNALIKNPVGGWNVIYPTLYNTLQAVIDDLATKLQCPTPLLFIDFYGIPSYQASALLMLDGSSQLHIGANFIKKLLLNASSDNPTTRYNAFRWTIAHELSHLSDPTFRLYGNLYSMRKVFTNVVTLLFFFGLATSLWSSLPGCLNFLTPLRMLSVGAAFWVIRKMFLIKLFRNFEYAADEKTMSISDTFTPHDAHYALRSIVSDMSSFLKAPYDKSTSNLVRFIGTCYERYMIIKLFHLHPSIQKRITHMDH